MNIVEIAILDNIESTLFRHRLPLITLCTSFKSSTSQCCTISNQHRIDIAYLQLPWFHRQSSTPSTSQCYTISNQHRVDIVYLLSPWLHRSHPWNCNVVRCRINILSILVASNYLVYFIHIVDIAMLYDIESASCRHRLPPISLFTWFTPSTMQSCTMSNQYFVKMNLYKIYKSI